MVQPCFILSIYLSVDTWNVYFNFSCCISCQTYVFIYLVEYVLRNEVAGLYCNCVWLLVLLSNHFLCCYPILHFHQQEFHLHQNFIVCCMYMCMQSLIHILVLRNHHSNCFLIFKNCANLVEFSDFFPVFREYIINSVTISI